MINSSAWAEINLENIKDNIYNIKKTLRKDTLICCVVKANAYGHGAVEVAKFLEKQKADFFAVSRLEEGLELIQNNIKTPILCMGYINSENIGYAVDNEIRITTYSLEMAQKINEIAKSRNKKAYIHIKVDTGMSRIGFLVNEESIVNIKKIFELDNLIVEGIFTHFAKADEYDKEDTFKQLEKYRHVIDVLKSENIDIPIKHVSNSAATLDLQECDFNMVRLGIAMYGHYPSDEVSNDTDLKPCFKLKSSVTNIKTIKKGTSVSYGFLYTAQKDTKIATVAIGYADGFPRTQKNPKVYINGRVLNIVGRICMDQTMVEIPDDLKVNIEDEVTVIGDVEGIRLSDVSKGIDTIDYEILCGINRRINRVYKSEVGEYEVNYLLD